jgi:hypothetical protein
MNRRIQIRRPDGEEREELTVGIDGEVLVHWKSSARFFRWFSTAMVYSTVFRRLRRVQRGGRRS